MLKFLLLFAVCTVYCFQWYGIFCIEINMQECTLNIMQGTYIRMYRLNE